MEAPVYLTMVTPEEKLLVKTYIWQWKRHCSMCCHFFESEVVVLMYHYNKGRGFH